MVTRLTLLLVAITGCQPQGMSVDSSKFAGMMVVNPLAYGSAADVAYVNAPTYRAFSIAGTQSDVVTVDVKSTNGDAIAWLVDGNYQIVAQNDDADDRTTNSHLTATLPSSGTFYIVFRELNLHTANLTVSLSCSGTCDGPCVPGAARCSGNQPEVCSPSGQWTVSGATCPFVCVAGACSGICVPSSDSCFNEWYPQTCDSTGQWAIGAACAGPNCLDGQCRTTQ